MIVEVDAGLTYETAGLEQVTAPIVEVSRVNAEGTTAAKAGLGDKKGKASPYSITERIYRVPELILVLGSQPAGDASHEPGGRLPLLSARPAVTLATLKMAANNFAAW